MGGVVNVLLNSNKYAKIRPNIPIRSHESSILRMKLLEIFISFFSIYRFLLAFVGVEPPTYIGKWRHGRICKIRRGPVEKPDIFHEIKDFGKSSQTSSGRQALIRHSELVSESWRFMYSMPTLLLSLLHNSIVAVSSKSHVSLYSSLRAKRSNPNFL